MKTVIEVLMIVLLLLTAASAQDITELEQYALDNPLTSEAHLKLGRAYQQSGQFFKAEKALKKAVEIDKGNETAYIFLGELYYNNNQYNLASENYSKALEIHKCASYYNHYGNSLLKANNIKEALDAYKKALGLDPKNPLILYNLGILYRKSGNEQKYRKLYLKLFKLDKKFARKMKNDTELFLFPSGALRKPVKKKNTKKHN